MSTLLPFTLLGCFVVIKMYGTFVSFVEVIDVFLFYFRNWMDLRAAQPSLSWGPQIVQMFWIPRYGDLDDLTGLLWCCFVLLVFPCKYFLLVMVSDGFISIVNHSFDIEQVRRFPMCSVHALFDYVFL